MEEKYQACIDVMLPYSSELSKHMKLVGDATTASHDYNGIIEEARVARQQFYQVHGGKDFFRPEFETDFAAFSAQMDNFTGLVDYYMACAIGCQQRIEDHKGYLEAIGLAASVDAAYVALVDAMLQPDESASTITQMELDKIIEIKSSMEECEDRAARLVAEVKEDLTAGHDLWGRLLKDFKLMKNHYTLAKALKNA